MPLCTLSSNPARAHLTHTPCCLHCTQHCVCITAGPFAARLPDELTPILDLYATALEYSLGGDAAYLFHPPTLGLDRPMESSAWTAWVKRLFKRFHGAEIAPKTLRSVFITWLRETTDCPEVLKSAAHAMKHAPNMQASTHYDANADTKLVKAAYDFNLRFAAQFSGGGGWSSGGGSGAGAGSSGSEPQGSDHASLEWELLAPQPAQFKFKRSKDDSFTCVVPWLDAFAPGMQLRWPTVPGLAKGLTWQVPKGDHVKGKSLTVIVKVGRNAVRGDEFHARALHKKKAPMAAAPAPTPAESAVAVPPASLALEQDVGELPAPTDETLDEPSELSPTEGASGQHEVGDAALEQDLGELPDPTADETPAKPSEQSPAEGASDQHEVGDAALRQDIGELPDPTADETPVEPNEQSPAEGASGQHEVDDATAEPPCVASDEEVQAESPGAATEVGQADLDSVHSAGAEEPADVPTDHQQFATARRASARTIKKPRLSFPAPARTSAVPASAKRPLVANEAAFDVAGITPGDIVLAMGLAPSGHRAWFQATVLALRKHPAWPPITVKYIGDETGCSEPLLLPQPRVAYVIKADTRAVP